MQAIRFLLMKEMVFRDQRQLRCRAPTHTRTILIASVKRKHKPRPTPPPPSPPRNAPPTPEVLPLRLMTSLPLVVVRRRTATMTLSLDQTSSPLLRENLSHFILILYLEFLVLVTCTLCLYFYCSDSAQPVTSSKKSRV